MMAKSSIQDMSPMTFPLLLSRWLSGGIVASLDDDDDFVADLVLIPAFMDNAFDLLL